MNRRLVNEFKERWPSWFKGLSQSPMESCLAFGFECGDGWKHLLWNLCTAIEFLGPPDDFEVYQVKEKFGGLRFYTSGASDAIYELIEEAERKSYETCEECGNPGKPNKTGWITTLCEECRGDKERTDH